MDAAAVRANSEVASVVAACQKKEDAAGAFEHPKRNPFKIEARRKNYIRTLVLDREAVAAATGVLVGDVKLGFEIKLTAREEKGVDVQVKTVDASGLAAHPSHGSAVLRIDDDLLEINGTTLATLPAGAAGRIYLFRLLAAPRVSLQARTKKILIGYVDESTIGSTTYGTDAQQLNGFVILSELTVATDWTAGVGGVFANVPRGSSK